MRTDKRRDILQLCVIITIIVLVNYIFSILFFRLDLTTEKRYSLSNATKKVIESVNDIVFVRVYLDGDLPAGFNRLRDATREMLDEFRAYSDGNMEYEFINPSASTDEKTRLEVYKQLSKQGLQYSNLEYRDGDKTSEKIIFPGAIVAYRGKETPVQLLKSQAGAHPEVMLNNSIQQLEYELANAIYKLNHEGTDKVAFIEGHGELSCSSPTPTEGERASKKDVELEVADIAKTINEFYSVVRVKIDGRLNSLKGFKAIVVAQPDSIFSEKDKFIIDQYIMNGGKVLWLIDGVNATMDSIRSSGTTMGLASSINLDDMLFKYGARVNTNLVLDLNSLPIPVVTGYIGNQPKQEYFPWYYFPLIIPDITHPVVNNLDAIMTQFVSTVDTVGGKGISKTILLKSSKYSKVTNAPVRISINMLREPPDERQFSASYQPVAVLLEGEFESVFKNRVPPEIANNQEIGFREKSSPTKMIVIGDGDIIRNEVSKDRSRILPLGFDKYSKREYANRNFIMNCLHYLSDESGLIIARGKELKLRQLDLQRVDKERLRWQFINTVLPVLLMLSLAFTLFQWRKRKFGW